ncbi:MAG TPA: peptidoglycan DD-metalloendopeptidase family protein [Candidatus Fimicola cottocaccae]|nr:peptidoglycan DD-metalloendopeptidase family protein [Candidatus Fimicola cottocaccae]
MKKYLRGFFAVTFAFSLAFSQVADAKTLNELKQEQSDLANKKQQTQNALNETKAKQQDISAEIESLDKVVTEAQNQLDAVKTELNEVTARLAESEIQLKEATDKKEAQLKSFETRIKFLHENGSIGYLQIILSAESFTDFLTRMQYVNDIMNYDNKLLGELKESERVIEEKTKEIAEDKARVEVLVAEQQTKTDELNAKMAEKQATYSQYQLDAAKYEQELASWDKASKEVESLIAQASAASTRSSSNSGGSAMGNVTYTGGQFAWPVPGRSYISSGYGYRSRPIGSGSEFHTGYDIPASYGANIVAAEAGTVIYASYMNGYGYTVMINHGGGLVTLYGHNSKLVVSKGDTVSRGQVIAKAGSTGNSTGNHCHFEVRLNGSHTSPKPYLGV